MRSLIFISCLIIGISSLQCNFAVQSNNLNVQNGIDTCEQSDNYCVKIMNFNGISAKGCSMTARKLTFGVIIDRCAGSGGCNVQNTICCCTGNKCNGSAGLSVAVSMVILGIVSYFLNY